MKNIINNIGIMLEIIGVGWLLIFTAKAVIAWFGF